MGAPREVVENLEDVGDPPMPLGPQIPIVDRTGRPTVEYHQWLMKTWHWHRRLLEYLRLP
jgi:hypothetical protein